MTTLKLLKIPKRKKSLVLCQQCQSKTMVRQAHQAHLPQNPAVPCQLRKPPLFLTTGSNRKGSEEIQKPPLHSTDS